MTFISRLCTSRCHRTPSGLADGGRASARRLTNAGFRRPGGRSLRAACRSGDGLGLEHFQVHDACSAFSRDVEVSGLIRYWASHKRLTPNPEADHGALQPSDHRHRWPATRRKSALRVEHEPSVPSTDAPAQLWREKECAQSGWWRRRTCRGDEPGQAMPRSADSSPHGGSLRTDMSTRPTLARSIPSGPNCSAAQPATAGGPCMRVRRCADRRRGFG